MARHLLGKVLVHRGPDGRERSARVVETEAYGGPEDAASHARGGPNGRGGLMYGRAGVAYVYLIYGVHHCFNAVTGAPGEVGAVLVRAAEPVAGVEGQRLSGPGLLCRALGIDRDCNGLDLTGSGLIFRDGPAVSDADVRVGRRVGVDYAGAWAERPWRFWVAGSQAVSRRTAGEPFARGD